MPDEMCAALRVLIIDDEPLARDCVRLALRDVPEVEILDDCRDGPEAVRAIERLRPDVVFLDVQMPGEDGFSVIDRVGAAEMPAVVFVTAYDTHAIRAFEVHALDYVLKPFENGRLIAALERARESLHARDEGHLARRLASLLADWTSDEGRASSADRLRNTRGPAPDRGDPGDGHAERFTVRHDDRIQFVGAEEVDFIEADGNYAVLHAGAATHRVRLTLQAIERQLDPRRFARIHRSTIVNLARVREIQPWFGGDYVAILQGGHKLRVSRTRAAPLLRPLR